MEIFKESSLPSTFASELRMQVEHLISEGQSFSLVGMPSTGIAPFIKFLISRHKGLFIHLDMYELETTTKRDLLNLLYKKMTGKMKEDVTFFDCKTVVTQLLTKHERVVIVFSKFDLLHHEFSTEFFGNLRTLCHGTDGRVSFMFSITKPFMAYSEEAVSGSNLHIFSRLVYARPYTDTDLLALLKLHSPELLQHEHLEEALRLAQGHTQLVQLILRSEWYPNVRKDPYVRLLLREIVQTFSFDQRRELEKIAQDKEIIVDPYLLHIGVVTKTGNKLTIFSPIVKEYLLEKNNGKLPLKERLLFTYLKSQRGKIVSREKIITEVWKQNAESATDWALDALIYRLRRQRYLKDKGYEIINHKKLGYQMIRV